MAIDLSSGLLKNPYLRQMVRRLFTALVLFSVAIGGGVIGFVLIEDYSLTQAFYMTVITLSTVGFTEVKPLSDTGQIFTSILILTNIGLFLYLISSLTSFFVEGDARMLMQNYKITSKINHLEGHTIICGFGRNGEQVYDELAYENQQVVVVEKDDQIVERLREDGVLYIQGDATVESVLEQTNLRQAKALISTLPKDADNVYVALTAREWNPQMTIISRASHDSTESKLYRAGCNYVIMPEKIGGSHMAAIVMKPDTMEFIGLLTKRGKANFFFEEIHFEQLKAEHQTKKIGELEDAYQTDANIIGLKTKEGQFIISPKRNTPLEAGCKLIVLGNSEQLMESQRLWLKGN